MDIGGNTGRFTIEVCKYNKDVNVTIVDLNKQLIAAEENIKTHGFIDRVSFVEQNMLSENINLPKDIDVIWMSQFLDCFSESTRWARAACIATPTAIASSSIIIRLEWQGAGSVVSPLLVPTPRKAKAPL